jgi:hypothetical protein
VRRFHIFGAVLFGLVAVLFVAVLLGPDDRGYSKEGYGAAAIWAALMCGVGIFLARRSGAK